VRSANQTTDHAHDDAAPATAPGPPTVRAGCGRGALTLGALGVVFGDIGTSPLYTMQAVFASGRVSAGAADVYGVVSLVVWTLTLVVSLKYVTFVMRADSDGEGGMMALIARVHNLGLTGRRSRAGLVAAGLFGVSLFVGDGMITPAISVLSAVEGVELDAPGLKSAVVPIALVILTGLFAVQHFGTSILARCFGPVMAAWFSVLALVGALQLAAHPAILRAVSPTYGLEFLVRRPGIAFVALGAVVLAVTGAEALYADMGHFGRPAIRRAWFWLVFPALSLNYLGQGSLILQTPGAVASPFYLLAPDWGRTPLVVLATAATVIASQALISGTFSLAREAHHLGYLPRLTIVHTSEGQIGQVYVPAINALLFVAVVGIVLGFGSSQHLAAAYGLAVTGTFVITSVLFLVIARRSLGWTARRTAAIAAVLLTVDLTLFAANFHKIVAGGWLPLIIGLGAFTVMTTWHRGVAIVIGNRARDVGPLPAYVDALADLQPPLLRLRGTAVFLSADKAAAPLAFREHVEHLHALHEAVVILAVVTEQRAHVPIAERIVVDSLGRPDDHIVRLTARYGFKDRVDVPACLRVAAGHGLPVDVANPLYFVSRTNLKRTPAPGMRQWRKRLFVLTARNAADPVECFALPDDRVIILGARTSV
jgi:KUP system potassium uptake protein